MLEEQISKTEISEIAAMQTRKPSSAAMMKAGAAWCQPSTSGKIMDTDLAIEFALIIDDIDQNPDRWNLFKKMATPGNLGK